ncbi:DUF4406 domain-containing protein [Mucilaginibacter psychrotolerans]|uniref:DUF4406 domain-containing protein n=1 Tax=Mucilaginibacter psychrotolerans TaxID=1524096 RepID=A0A4Y8S8C4_9SPHI|nr:DUF4406 domain-containing protein [Mucilaginibacter psychrotolerans]TFF35228.1 DUF4406 domain-containing protein [Mucilaginibacter psychrotolerans]
MEQQTDEPIEFPSGRRVPSVYLSGQVTGVSAPVIYTTFRAKQLELEALDFKVLNRCEVIPKGMPPAMAQRVGLGMLLTADFICMIPGWDDCDQAKTERALALKLNMPSIDE